MTIHVPFSLRFIAAALIQASTYRARRLGNGLDSLSPMTLALNDSESRVKRSFPSLLVAEVVEPVDLSGASGCLC